jgi:hypothetical protein
MSCARTRLPSVKKPSQPSYQRSGSWFGCVAFNAPQQSRSGVVFWVLELLDDAVGQLLAVGRALVMHVQHSPAASASVIAPRVD